MDVDRFAKTLGVISDVIYRLAGAIALLTIVIYLIRHLFQI